MNVSRPFHKPSHGRARRLQVDQAQTDAGQGKLDVKCKPASQKCESMAGDARSVCTVAATSRDGKI